MDLSTKLPQQTHVLLIEDEPRYREMLSEAVSSMGFGVRGAATAEQALRALAQFPSGIVVLDLNLPGMNGIDLLEIIRREYPLVQVIILTGYGSLEAAQKAIRCDVVDLITKPCQLQELELSLNRAMNRWNARATRLGTGGPPRDSESSAPPLEEIERSHILAAMKRHRGSRRAAADELGISLRTLYNRLRQYKYVDPPANTPKRPSSQEIEL